MATVDIVSDQLPSLPREIVSAIIGYLSESTSAQDLVYAWAVCRGLSFQIKNDVETAFCKLQLRRTHFRFDRDNGWGDQSPSIWFDFDRLADDGSTAIFLSSKLLDRPTKEQVLGLFQCLTKPTRRGIISPSHSVQIGEDSNDIQIPYVALYPGAQKIVVDWKKLYTAYFSEYLLWDKLYADWTRNIGIPWAKKSRAQADRGEIDYGPQMMEAFMMGGNAYKDSRNRARRVRVCRQYQVLTGQPLVLNKSYLRREAATLKNLHEERFMRQFAEIDNKERQVQKAESSNYKQADQRDRQVDEGEQETEYRVAEYNADDDVDSELEEDYMDNDSNIDTSSQHAMILEDLSSA